MANKVAFADTNLFIRFFTNDVPAQADAVAELFRRAANGELTLVINHLSLAEMIWVLESSYSLGREDIRRYILGLLNTPGLKVDSPDLITQAIDLYVRKNIDFIDAYSASWMKANSIEKVYTFDKRHFSRVEDIEVEVPII